MLIVSNCSPQRSTIVRVNQNWVFVNMSVLSIYKMIYVSICTKALQLYINDIANNQNDTKFNLHPSHHVSKILVQ